MMTIYCDICGSKIDCEDRYYYDDMIHCEACFNDTIKTVIIPNAKYDAKEDFELLFGGAGNGKERDY